MIFSKQTILKHISEGTITIAPFDESLLKPASYTLRLGEAIEIPPHGFLLAKSLEKLTLSSGVACMVFTKPSVAQQGVEMTLSSPFCQPDTDNLITFEISNRTDEVKRFAEGEPVATAVFMQVI
jgi:dCTP deaminase